MVAARRWPPPPHAPPPLRLDHETRHFNVGQYRRRQKGEDEVQDASFFDYRNAAGRGARHRALAAALDDMEAWLSTPSAQVAGFDATNSTADRRGALRARFHGRWQYLFIESICNDPAVLELNYRFKMMYSPDYEAADTGAALADFRVRRERWGAGWGPCFGAFRPARPPSPPMSPGAHQKLRGGV